MAKSILHPTPQLSQSTEGQNNTPNSWVVEMDWRYPWPSDTAFRARKARESLARLGLYPTTTREGDPGYTQAAANEKAALAQITNELSADDLAAVYRLARLLALRPGAVDVWAAGLDYAAVMA